MLAKLLQKSKKLAHFTTMDAIHPEVRPGTSSDVGKIPYSADILDG